MKVLFIIHRLYFNGNPKEGGIDDIRKYFEKKDVFLIEHPFEVYDHQSSFIAPSKKDIFSEKIYFKPPFVWVYEIFLNLKWCFKIKEKYDWVFVSDPLNFLSAYFLKKFGIVNKIHWHSIDYSPKRFKSIFLDKIYQKSYFFACKKSNRITVVSKNMFRLVVKNRNNSDSVFFLPNSPNYSDVPRVDLKSKNIYSIVLTMSRLKQQIDIKKILDAIIILKKEYPQIVLNIVGHVDEKIEEELKERYGDILKFYGFVSREKCLDIISYSGIGIVWYTTKESYVHFADSLKIREYAAAGLPIISNNVMATSEEIKKENIGFVVNSTEEIYNKIRFLFDNQNKYLELSKNAQKWAKKNDKEILLKEIFDEED